MVQAVSAQYALTSSSRIITRDNRTDGKTDLLPADIARKAGGIPLDAGELLITKTETNITLETPKGPGHATLPANTRMKVSAIAASSMFSLQKRGSMWDIFLASRQVNADNKRPAGVESGGTRVGVKEGSYDGPGHNISPRDNVRLSKINDSLAKSGVKDSVVYYLHNAIFLEQAAYTRAAKKDYKRALKFAIKTGQDTTLVSIINRDFAERNNAPASSGSSNSERKSATDDFFK